MSSQNKCGYREGQRLQLNFFFFWEINYNWIECIDTTLQIVPEIDEKLFLEGFWTLRRCENGHEICSEEMVIEKGLTGYLFCLSNWDII